MMIKIQVKGGTGKHSEDLCQSCRYANIRVSDKGKRVYCQSFGEYIYSETRECSSYYNRSLPTLSEMAKIAWVIVPGKMALGFKRFADMEENDQSKIQRELIGKELY